MPPNPNLMYKNLLLAQVHHKPPACRPETALLTLVAGELALKRDPRLIFLKDRHPLAENAHGVPNLLVVRLEAVYHTNSLTISLAKGVPEHAKTIANRIIAMNRIGFSVEQSIGHISTHTEPYGREDRANMVLSEAGFPRASITISFSARNYETVVGPGGKLLTIEPFRLFAKGIAHGIYELLGDFDRYPLLTS